MCKFLKLIDLVKANSLLVFLAVVFLFEFGSVFGQNSLGKKAPNILMILVDDLRPALGCYGDDIAVTPYIDNLASQGMRFDKAYANQAVCAPSRFNLMLGSRSTSTGIYGFGQNFRDYYPEAVTLPQFFKNHGYHTEAMGKVFHIGHGTYQDEKSWSVPHYHDLVIEYVDSNSKMDGYTREEALFSNKSAGGLPKGPAWESPDVDDESYADGRIAKRAVMRLRQLKSEQTNNPEKSFFLTVGFARPHLPFSAPKKYWDRFNPETLPMPEIEVNPKGAPSYAPKRNIEIDQYIPIPHSTEADPFPEELTRKLIHGYYASVSFMDEQVGKVLSALKQLELDENTIVVFWGDHGYHLGELGIWTKHVNYELANRIPLIISAPGVSKPGSSSKQLVESVDIFPTLVELAGLSQPDNLQQPYDGLSMVSVLEQPEIFIRDHAYHCFLRGKRLGRAIRTDRYRMVEWKEIGLNDKNEIEYELYDYQNGPVELENIAVDSPDILSRLKKVLESHSKPHPDRPR